MYVDSIAHYPTVCFAITKHYIVTATAYDDIDFHRSLFREHTQRTSVAITQNWATRHLKNIQSESASHTRAYVVYIAKLSFYAARKIASLRPSYGRRRFTKHDGSHGNIRMHPLGIPLRSLYFIICYRFCNIHEIGGGSIRMMCDARQCDNHKAHYSADEQQIRYSLLLCNAKNEAKGNTNDKR